MSTSSQNHNCHLGIHHPEILNVDSFNMIISQLFIFLLIITTIKAPAFKYVEITRRILAGYSCDISKYPYYIAMYDGDDRYQVCGGSLLNYSYVLTAAHCCLINNTFIVKSGQRSKHNNFEQQSVVEKIYVHQDFNWKTMDNDVCLLKLKISFTKSSLTQPVNLASMEMITQVTKKGYFWHITDFHYDPHFTQHGDVRKGCWKPDAPRASHRRPLSRYGDYSCDAPWDLIESATRAMMSRQGDNVEFVLWTGDSLSRKKQVPETKQLHYLQNLTDLLLKTFNSQFVFPALGHDDPTSRHDLGKMWSRWLPTDTIETLETGGYYMIEKTDFKRHIIVLNTNLMTEYADDVESTRQWDWLTAKLDKVYQKKETVYIVGHIPPGLDERQKAGLHPEHLMYTDRHNRKYLSLVKKYASIIHGQFFGHLHSDSFRVIYNEKDVPVSWVMLAPAMTPRRTTDGANNPGLRLYKFKKDTGQILDYTQYYLDLSMLNSNQKEPEWTVEYNFSSYYGISNITPLTLHTLAERLTSPASPHDHAFSKYYRANSVRMYKDLGSCDANCARTHYCAITKVDYEEHEHCLKTAASALASSSGSQANVSISSIMLLMVLIILCLV